VLRSIKVMYHTYDLGLQCPYCRAWCTYGVEARNVPSGDIRVVIRDDALSPFTVMVPDEQPEDVPLEMLNEVSDSEDETEHQGACVTRTAHTVDDSSSSSESDHDYP
jgi:hypothetical protein